MLIECQFLLTYLIVRSNYWLIEHLLSCDLPTLFFGVIIAWRDTNASCWWTSGPSRGTQSIIRFYPCLVLLFDISFFFNLIIYCFVFHLLESGSRDSWCNRSILGEVASLCNSRVTLHAYSWWSCWKQFHWKSVRDYLLFNVFFFLLIEGGALAQR